MQTDVAETIYEKVKVLPPEKQQEILHQIEILEQKLSRLFGRKSVRGQRKFLMKFGKKCRATVRNNTTIIFMEFRKNEFCFR